MKYIFTVFSLMCLLLSGCILFRPKPRHPDDIPLKINLKKGYVSAVGVYTHPEKGAYLEGSGKKGRPENLGEAVLLGMLNVMIDGLQIALSGGTDVYVQPAGYSKYKQQIYWGKNTIYIPAHLKNTVWFLQILVDGNYVGEETIGVTPGQRKIKLTPHGRAIEYADVNSVGSGEVQEPCLQKPVDTSMETDTEKNSDLVVVLPGMLRYSNLRGMLEVTADCSEEQTLKVNTENIYVYEKEVIYKRGETVVNSDCEYYEKLPLDNIQYSSIYPQPGCMVILIYSVVEVQKGQMQEQGKTVFQRRFSYTAQ